MSLNTQQRHLPEVALRKESVDRNVIGDVMGKVLAGRSPQGERG